MIRYLVGTVNASFERAARFDSRLVARNSSGDTGDRDVGEVARDPCVNLWRLHPIQKPLRWEMPRTLRQDGQK